MTAARDNLDQIRDALRADAPNVARALLGEPNPAASNKRTLRWGSKGSMSVEVAGPKKGFWFSHEGGEGSDLLGLIRHVKACRFPDAVEWASRYTGIVPDNDDGWQPRARRSLGPSQTEADAARAAEAAEAEADEAKRIALACQIAAGCVPLAGTLGERYLKQTRGIPAPAAEWPASIQFNPAYGALVAIATAPDGNVRAVQRIHLGDDAAKISDDERAARRLPAVKVTNGVTIGAVVRLPGNPAGPLLIAEGPETALSVYTATGHETWVSLGTVTKVQPPTGRKVVVVSDDNPAAHDARYGQAAKALRKALQTWRRAGVDLVVATPWRVRRKDRSDFADVILQHGVEAVRERVREALQPARLSAERLPVDQARKAVGEAVGNFFDLVNAASVKKAEWDNQVRHAMDGTAPPFQLTEQPARTFDEEADQWEAALNATMAEPAPTVFVHGIRCDVGTGKSHTARQEIARTLAAMRERDDDREMVLAVPQHALSDEQAVRFRELAIVQKAGLRVEIWRGRGTPDPDHPDYRDTGLPRDQKTKMCQNMAAVKEAHDVGLPAQTSCCKRQVTQPDGTKATVKCPFYAGCSYQAQAERDADLWIVASDLLWHEKPSAIGEVATLIVDEGAWRKGLVGAEGRHLALSLDSLLDDTKFPLSTKGLGGAESERRLQDLRRQLSEALRFAPDGPLTKKTIAGTLLTADSAAEALKLEWARKVDMLHPGQSREERRAAIAASQGNKSIPRFALLWNALRELLSDSSLDASGWVSIETERTKDGPVRVLHLKGRKNVADGWKAPTLLLDALLPVGLTQFFWPDLELVADVKAQMPHQHVRQVVDRAFAKSMLEPLDEEAAAINPEEAQRRTNRLHDLRAILIREARRYAPGRVLVVLQKRIKEALSDLGSLPPNLELAHHNNVAGRDEWRDVSALIVVGRTQPPPSAIKRIAEALTGQATSHLADWYERADAVREMVDGSAVQAETERHPDSLADEIRWQTCEGELLQIIGRARGVNRTAADPVDVLVLTDVPLPIPLAGVLNAVELTPGPGENMIAAGGVLFENARHASTAYPWLWASHNAADLAMRRSPSFSNREYIKGKDGLLAQIHYQLAGRGSKPVRAWFAADLCPDPETFLRERLGELAWCRVEGAEPPPDPKPAKGKRKPPAAEPMPPVHEPAADEPPEAPETGRTPSPCRAPPEPTEIPMTVADVVGLEPAAVYPAGLSLAPHPSFPPYDALPVDGMWRINRQEMPGLVVMQVRSPFRVISARPDADDPEARPWVRVQGEDGIAEPVGITARRWTTPRFLPPDTRVAHPRAHEAGQPETGA